jgi:hypothetical protein
VILFLVGARDVFRARAGHVRRYTYRPEFIIAAPAGHRLRTAARYRPVTGR